ncbi:MAG TPA: hypothetical protein VGB08_00950 [Allosphingosinicella sp.]|jgi:hypothetical protein
MKEWGAGLVAVGIVIVVFGALIDISVTAPYVSGGGYMPSIPSHTVANVHKMHVQSLVVHGGYFTAMAGVILVACGAIADRLETPRTSAPDLPAPIPSAAAAAPDEQEPSSRGDDAPGNVAPMPAGMTSSEWPALAGYVVGTIILIALIATFSQGGGVQSSEPVDMNAVNQSLSDADNTLRELNEADARDNRRLQLRR